MRIIEAYETSSTTRRNFVRQTLVTTVTTSLGGLIRAHGGGGGGGETTTSSPWGTTVETTYDTTFDTTLDTTVVTTAPSKPKQRVFRINLWLVKGENFNSPPSYTAKENDASIYSDNFVDVQPPVDGLPDEDSGSPNGKVTVGNVGLDDSHLIAHQNIFTNEQLQSLGMPGDPLY